MLFAFKARAKSSERAVNLLTLMPGAGSSSYWVIIGPKFTFETLASMLNSASFYFNIWETFLFSSSNLALSVLLSLGGVNKKDSTSGFWYNWPST